VEARRKFNVVVEIDVTQMHRTGIPYEEAFGTIMELSERLGINTIGLYAYAYMYINGTFASSPEKAGVNVRTHDSTESPSGHRPVCAPVNVGRLD